ncbi:hypothetical protein LTE61_004392 [Salmonella enterica subsp. enterica serovar Westminster]|nr:hypothetical protein [Salmonella enterica subsp. enterica serovar Westminster]
MRKLTLVMMCFTPGLAIADAQFVNPMDFDGTDVQKEQVVQYITEHVHKMYCDSALDMCQDTMLRMMERQELSAFKEATQATDKKIMKKVIETYCEGAIDMCSYSTVVMMYRSNLKASQQTLEW